MKNLNFSLTKNCEEIINLIKINDCQLYNEEEIGITKKIFKGFYDDFVDAENFLKTVDINPEVEKIKNNNYNKSNDHGYIIKPIREYIDEFAEYDITYSLKLYNKIVNIFFITGKNFKIEEIKRKIYRIILWLHVIIKYATNKFCSKELNIYIFLI